jgi:hypothetical protein
MKTNKLVLAVLASAGVASIGALSGTEAGDVKW